MDKTNADDPKKQPPVKKKAAAPEAEEEAEPVPEPTSAALDRLRETMPGAVEEAEFQHGDPIVRLRPEKAVDACRFLKEDGQCRMTLLSNLSGVDMSAAGRKDPRFDVVYHVYSVETAQRMTLKVAVAEGAETPSVTPVWRTANWHERETWDMFGIRFSGHPDLRRILMPEEFDAHPLRKDFPLEGREKDHGYWRKPEDEKRYRYTAPDRES